MRASRTCAARTRAPRLQRRPTPTLSETAARQGAMKPSQPAAPPCHQTPPAAPIPAHPTRSPAATYPRLLQAWIRAHRSPRHPALTACRRMTHEMPAAESTNSPTDSPTNLSLIPYCTAPDSPDHLPALATEAPRCPHQQPTTHSLRALLQDKTRRFLGRILQQATSRRRCSTPAPCAQSGGRR
jgi:hypothetical protein